MQGVGFRYRARQAADMVGCTGWVRNEWDGSVSMELQGRSHDLAVYFTLFDRQYASYPLRYVIEEKDDIAPVQGERDFRVEF